MVFRGSIPRILLKLTLLNKKQMNKRKFTHEDFNMIIGMTTIAGLIIYNIVANGIMLS